MSLEAFNSPNYYQEDMDFNFLEPCAKKKRSRRPRIDNPSPEEEYLAGCLLMLAQGDATIAATTAAAATTATATTTPPPLAYTCIICNRVFSSHQALGGHKASHRKILSGTGTKPFSSAGGGGATLFRSERAHECTVCHRTFTTGQALGGHKRCHYEGGGSGSGMTSEEGAGSSHTVRDFDLNLPASPELMPELSIGLSIQCPRESQLPGDHEVRSPPPVKKPGLANPVNTAFSQYWFNNKY